MRAALTTSPFGISCTEDDTKSPGNDKTGLTGALQGLQVSFRVTGDPEPADFVAPVTTFKNPSGDLQLTTLVALLAFTRTSGVVLRTVDHCLASALTQLTWHGRSTSTL